jgi:hypothetical protein
MIEQAVNYCCGTKPKIQNRLSELIWFHECFFPRYGPSSNR